MGDLAAFTAALALFGFGGFRLLRAVRGSDPAHRYVSGFALCLALSLVLLDSDVLARADRLTGRPTLVMALGDGLTLGAVGFVGLLAVSLSGPAAGRRHSAAAVGAQPLSAALLFAARPVTRPSDGSLVVRGAGRLLLAGHDALFAVWAVWALLGLGRVLVGHARRTPPGLLRTGLTLTSAACGTGVLWAGWTVDDVQAVLRTGVQGGADDTVSNLLAVVCAALTVGGATVMLWAERFGAPVRWLRAYRRHRALAPLWSALHAALPQIALSPAEPRPGWGARRAEFALYRRIIEIRDGHLALRPFFDPRVREWTAAPHGPGDPAVTEAAVIAAALEHRGAGRPPAPAAPVAAPPPALPPGEDLAGTIDAEAAWLLRVTRAFTGSPAVAAVRSRVRGDGPAGPPSGPPARPGRRVRRCAGRP